MWARRLKDPTLTSPWLADANTGWELTSPGRLHQSWGTHPQAGQQVRAGRGADGRGREGGGGGEVRGLRGWDHSWQHPLGTSRKLFCLPTDRERELRLMDLATLMPAAGLEQQSWLCCAAKVPSCLPSSGAYHLLGLEPELGEKRPSSPPSPQMLSAPGACASGGGTRAQIPAVCVCSACL